MANISFWKNTSEGNGEVLRKNALESIQWAEQSGQYDVFQQGIQDLKKSFSQGKNPKAFENFLQLFERYGLGSFTEGLQYNPAHIKLLVDYFNITERQFKSHLDPLSLKP